MQKMPKVAALAVMAKITHHQRGAGCSTTSEMRCVSQLKLRRFRTRGTCAIRRSTSWTSGAVADAPSILSLLRKRLDSTRNPDIFRVRHFRIWISKAGEITGPRNDIQIFEDPVVAVLFFHLRDAALRILDIAENDRFSGTGLRAGSGKRIARDEFVRRSACTCQRDDLG